jgi:antitoxin CptB
MIKEGDLAIRRRQLIFRSWHRGTREADLLLGPFADAFLPACPPEQVELYAALLEVEDPDLWDWVTGQKPIDPAHQGPVFDALLKFIAERKR